MEEQKKEAIQRLLNNGMIYETLKDTYKVTSE